LPAVPLSTCASRAGRKTGRGNGWTRSPVCVLRNHRGIAPYREGERAERGEATLDEAAAALNVSAATVRRMINEGLLPARQLCKGAPWVICTDDLAHSDVRRVADQRRNRRPSPDNPRQNEMAF
jgi:excisionase family DNA binding protein